ncbi:hypothetical protein SL053_002252 [Flavobacterium psychrophilum]|nr:hypothetical protein [Flavobacterium psychrophilum]
MQLSKSYFFLIIFILSISKIYSQPSAKKIIFEGSIQISDNNEILSFNTKDSLNFISQNNRIKMTLCQITNESSPTNKLLKLEKNYEKSYYLFNLLKNKCFKIRYRVAMYYEKKMFWSSKILFKIEKDEKIMLIYFDFTKYNSDTKIEKININFKEGSFELSSIENPKLVPLK